MRAQVTVENWDKGGLLSHWVYTHLSEVFPVAVVRRGGPIVDLPVQLRPEIGRLKLKNDDGSEQTLEQFVNNGAVDGCIVLHAGKVVYEKYPTIQPNDLHLIYSVTKAFVLTTFAILEGEGKIDPQRPVQDFLPELKGSGWAGIRLCDVADMRSGIEGNESSNDAYRNPAHNNSSWRRHLAGNRVLCPIYRRPCRAAICLHFSARSSASTSLVKTGLTPAAILPLSAK